MATMVMLNLLTTVHLLARPERQPRLIRAAERDRVTIGDRR
jgi:hypothetical protein